MDGEADDFVIDPNGNLVMLDSVEETQEAIVRVLDGGTVLAVVIQGQSGDLAVQVFGSPTKELASALHTATQGLLQVLKRH